MSQERDTHYANAARLLWEKLMAVHNGWIDVSNAGMDSEDIAEYQQIIAHFAFDFANHVIKHLHGSNLDEIRDEGLARYFENYPETERMPDMEKWPE